MNDWLFIGGLVPISGECFINQTREKQTFGSIPCCGGCQGHNKVFSLTSGNWFYICPPPFVGRELGLVGYAYIADTINVARMRECI